MSEAESRRPRPVVLCVLDGWGIAPNSADNAIAQAETPTMDRLLAAAPHATLKTSGADVGLPEGQMGNSEVGHMNLGAGRVVLQDLPRIDRAIEAGQLAGLPAFRDFVARLQASGGTAHLLGLLSPGGVHAHQRHMAALANALIAEGVAVAVHAFTDGRDTPPRAAPGYIRDFQAAAPAAPIVTVGGRYYAMDRDHRWARCRRAYEALVEARGESAADPVGAVERSHAAGIGDEFVAPTVIAGYRGMADGDGLLVANFRTDRVRQLLHALLAPGFDGFERGRTVAFAAAAGMVEYADDLNSLIAALFPPQELARTLGEVVAEAGLAQLRIAETEKYAHVTYFFSGGRERPFAGEERILVPSPQVATYDEKPEMSAPEVTDRLVEVVVSGRFDLVVVNYANGDMVGHTGDLTAAVRAIETVDACLGRLAESVAKAGGCLLVTADHGNAEQMRDAATGQPHTAHTMNPVPLVLADAPAWVAGLTDGRLADVAPTLLQLLGLEPPAEMPGRSLLRGRSAAAPAERRASA